MLRAHGFSISSVFLQLICFTLLSCATPQEESVEELTANDNTVSEITADDQVSDPELPNPEDALAEATKDAASPEENSDSVSAATIEALAAEQQIASSQLSVPPSAEAPAEQAQQTAEAMTIPSTEENSPSPSPRLPELSEASSDSVNSRADSSTTSQNHRTYVIQPGDTLVSIAKMIYGQKQRWKELAKLNKVANVEKIYAGKTLKFTSDSDSADYEARWDALAKNSIEIKKGDSLSSLARKHLGNAQHWTVLWSLNRETIENPNKIRVGSVVKCASKEDLAAFYKGAKDLQIAH